jgi:hypothetical protein
MTSERNEYRIEIINSLSAWENLAAAWNELLGSSRANTVFLTWDWLFSWAGCFLDADRRLFILAIHKNRELVGIAPWYLRRISRNFMSINQVEFLGSPEAGSDYLDIIIQAGKEREVAGVLYRYLFHDGRLLWDCLHLCDIPSDSLFLLHFQEIIEKEGKYAELSKGSYCPFAALPNNSDWIPGVSSGRKARFKQDLARLGKDGEISHRVLTGDAAAGGLEDFFSFHRDKSGRDGVQLHRFIRAFASRSLGRCLLRLDFLGIQGTTIAALLHLKYQDELLLYIMAADKAFNPRISAGNVLVGLCLKKAGEEGIARYDFLKGNEPYKFYWAEKGRSSLSLFITQKKLRPVIFTAARFMKYTAKILLR